MSSGSPREPHGTFWILEDPYLEPSRRWYCHWDGNIVPDLQDMDDAVTWGLTHARSVIVRTLDLVLYLAGERPPNHEGTEFQPWPPSDSEREHIDLAYQVWLAAELKERSSRAAYERDRDDWISVHAPELAGRGPAHKCVVLLPDESGAIEFEELDTSGSRCAGRRHGSSLIAIGTATEVITRTSGLHVGDPWVASVCAAIDSERGWTRRGRRSMLLVKTGEEPMFHVTAAANRESISQYGLDWRRMGAKSGIAGSREPELPATFLCESLEGAAFFTNMAREPSDVWSVQTDGLWLQGDPSASGGGDSNWMITTDPIEPDRLALAETDVAPHSRP